MSALAPRHHGILDYVTVVAFAVAPTVFVLTGLPRTICYVLAGVHLLLTLFTRFPLGAVRVVPLQIHGWIELVVSLALVALPWVLGFSGYLTARWFFVAAGVVIFVVWALTGYAEA